MNPSTDPFMDPDREPARETSREPAADPVQLLKNDLESIHNQLRDLCLLRTIDEAKLGQIRRELLTQAKVEEEQIFPFLARVLGTKITLDNFRGDHALIQSLLDQMESLPEERHATLMQLQNVFVRHLDTVERWLFPLLRDLPPEQSVAVAGELRTLLESKQATAPMPAQSDETLGSPDFKPADSVIPPS